jgi:hypothetical protein
MAWEDSGSSNFGIQEEARARRHPFRQRCHRLLLMQVTGMPEEDAMACMKWSHVNLHGLVAIAVEDWITS